MTQSRKLKLKAWVPREYSEQYRIFAWAKLHESRHPELKLLHASMNGAAMKSPQQAMTAKQAGMKNGVPDICLPVPTDRNDAADKFPFTCPGLYIELKRADGKGKVSLEQQWWLDQLNAQGYKAVVCHGADAAIKVIADYLGMTEDGR